MSSFFAGVKGWLFGSKDTCKETSSSSASAQQRAGVGHKRSRGQQQQEPVLQEVRTKTGGIQGLRWYATSLKVDADGDVAHEFLAEGPPAASNSSGNGTAASNSSNSSSSLSQQVPKGAPPHGQLQLQGVQQGNVLLTVGSTQAHEAQHHSSSSSSHPGKPGGHASAAAAAARTAAR